MNKKQIIASLKTLIKFYEDGMEYADRWQWVKDSLVDKCIDEGLCYAAQVAGVGYGLPEEIFKPPAALKRKGYWWRVAIDLKNPILIKQAVLTRYFYLQLILKSYES